MNRRSGMTRRHFLRTAAAGAAAAAGASSLGLGRAYARPAGLSEKEVLELTAVEAVATGGN